jgi:DNA-binding MarR family transcriptional regulator
VQAVFANQVLKWDWMCSEREEIPNNIAYARQEISLKERVPDEQSRKAISFLDSLGLDGTSRAEAESRIFAPIEFRDDPGQIEILRALIHRFYDLHVLSKHGLPELEWRILESVGYAPGVTAVELAQYWALEKMTVSRGVQSLKKNGLIRTQHRPTDKRSIELHHTALGARTFEEQSATKKQFINALSETVTPEEMGTFVAVTRKLIDHFRRVLELTKP